MSDNNKQYLLFAGHNYYPYGGALDYRMTGTIDECKQWFYDNRTIIADNNYLDIWGQIVDQDKDVMNVILYGKLEEKNVENNGLIYDGSNLQFGMASIKRETQQNTNAKKQIYVEWHDEPL